MTLEHFVPPFLRTWLEPQWAIQKVIGVVPSSELEQLLGTKWWRDYTTDFILERFKPWSIYISFNDMADPTGSDRLYEGAYVTFDWQDGELRLVIQHMTRTGVDQIRPMLYAGEGRIANLAKALALPIVENPCPEDRGSKRYEIKQFIRTMSQTYPDLRSKVFGAIQRAPLDGWEKAR